MDIIFSPVPLWLAVATFVMGWCIGWFIRGWYDHSKSSIQMKMETIIQVTVFVLWTIATARAAVYDGVAYPPFFLNLFFGAVVGSMNAKLGDYIISIAKVIKPRK